MLLVVFYDVQNWISRKLQVKMGQSNQKSVFIWFAHSQAQRPDAIPQRLTVGAENLSKLININHISLAEMFPVESKPNLLTFLVPPKKYAIKMDETFLDERFWIEDFWIISKNLLPFSTMLKWICWTRWIIIPWTYDL